MAEFWQVLTTTDSAEEADRLGRSAVEARLAACAQRVGPVASTYRWQGEVETAQEWQVLLKTPADRYEALAAHLRAQHTYELPEIVATPILAGNEAYLDWVRDQTR